MRMWMVNPDKMCRKHLLGEHVECHMFFGTLMKKKKIDGYIRNGLFEPQSLFDRHTALSDEMTSRGYNHNSDLDFQSARAAINTLPEKYLSFRIDRSKSLNDLLSRCPLCSQRSG